MGHFFPFHTPSLQLKPEKSEFRKNKKKLLDTIVWNKCSKKHNHMRYGSWDTEWDRERFCRFEWFYSLLTPWQPTKSRFWNNEKSIWKCHHFTHVYQYHMMYVSWVMECNRNNFLPFWAIFCHLTPLAILKFIIWKKYKKHLEILCFYTYVP